MDEMNVHSIFLMQSTGYMFGAIYRAVLSTRATERNLQMAKAAFQEPLYVVIYQLIYVLQELQYLAVFLQEVDHRLVQSGQLLILLVLTGIVRTAAVEYISSSVAAGILRDAFLEREGIDGNS